MIFIELDAYEMVNKESACEYIAEKFDIDLENTDLQEMLQKLTDINYEVVVKLRNSEMIEKNLGDYGMQLIETLNNAGQKNPLLHMRFLWTNI